MAAVAGADVDQPQGPVGRVEQADDLRAVDLRQHAEHGLEGALGLGTLVEPAVEVDAGTGAIFRRQNARFVVAEDLAWFFKTLVTHGPHMAVWVNKLVKEQETGIIKTKSVLLKKDEAPILEGVRLVHKFNERGTRDQVRHMAKGAYYRNGLSKEEKDFREKHNI